MARGHSLAYGEGRVGRERHYSLDPPEVWAPKEVTDPDQLPGFMFMLIFI
jgi:hypothetical protein